MVRYQCANDNLSDQFSARGNTPRFFVEDDADGTIESKLAQVAVEVLVVGELHYRDSRQHQFDYWVKRQQELRERLARENAEAEARERQRIRRLDQARIDELLREARALSDADTIRRYVSEVRARADAGSDAKAVADWAAWAMDQAARIDPILSRAFLNPGSESESQEDS